MRSTARVLTRLVTCAAAVVSAHVAAPDAVQAGCVAPEPNVIWSFPATDETNVPLDADLLVVTEGIMEDATITLDGEPLSAVSEMPGHYDLGVLDPSTRYEVAIKALSWSGVPAELKWSFTTSAALISEDGPDSIEIARAQSRRLALSATIACKDALFADTCFDMGDPMLESFETDTDAALWAVEIIQTMPSEWRLYPGECGQPRALDRGTPLDGGVRYRVHAVQRNGSLANSQTIEGPLRSAPTGSDGCAAAPGRDAGARLPVCLLAAACVAVLRRIRRT